MVKWRSMLLGLAISAVCIVLLLRSVDLSTSADAFSRADPLWIAIALGTIAAALTARVWKWQLLFRPDDRVSFWGALSASLIGYMFNTVLPGRVGELARASLVGQTEGVSAARAVGTIFVEKITDVLMLLLMLGALTALIPLPRTVTAAGISATITFGALGVAFFALGSSRAAVVRWLERRVDPLPVLRRLRPSRLVDLALGASRAFSQPQLVLLQILSTAVLWISALFTCICVLRAFHIDLPWPAAMLLLVITNLGMTIPSAPGYVGVYEGLVVFALALFGVDSSVALSAGIALHVLGFGSFTLLGALCLLEGLLRQRYTLSGLWSWSSPPTSTATPPLASGAR